ncbi:hypothetical protein [uncultured Pseudoteredinibacter sp.]|uniref:hypothetical protein n=1 Tax=uncultured Pseudoteredinibacter sp. TaxID=1641701 RepID=UPI002626EB46|nr:hypothetical protein [uncultured Pseudoteredinibacter sp.]
MSQVFILQNQDGYFLSKQKEWVDGRDASVLYRSPHRDEALNQMVEVNSKDYTQRISIVDCQLSEKRHPILDPESLPEPKIELPENEASTENDVPEAGAQTSDAEINASEIASNDQ